MEDVSEGKMVWEDSRIFARREEFLGKEANPEAVSGVCCHLETWRVQGPQSLVEETGVTLHWQQ